ncbi:MAG: ABC transporter ATP-binding protein [Eubacterium sp.]|nr:ABC transporter ATP-binding protein [Eubacterium sp.]
MEMLAMSHVAKRFGEKQVLRDVTFRVPEHTVFGFAGKNGAGKTTAMKLILGLLASDSGEILVNGMPVRYGNTETNRLVGYLPDVPEFYSYMTPREYLRFCGEIAGMASKDIRIRSEELLSLVGLANENYRIRGFSRGMKQRLGIAQALFGRPKLLICDEPASALDPAGRKELLDILADAKEQTTVLFSTHILSDAEHICDEVAFLHEGKIVLQGPVAKVRSMRKAAPMRLELERPEDVQILLSAFPRLTVVRRCMLMLEECERLPDLLRFLADRRISILRMERGEASLEDLFMEVVGK